MKKLIFCFLFSVIICSLFAQQYGWTDISANIPGSPDLSDVFFVSVNEGWISSSSQLEIYYTIDGGETFEIQTTQTSLEAIYMNNASNGYCGGGSGFVYNTGDGGTNWDFLGTMATTLTDLDFVSINQGYACGNGGAVFSITPQGVTNLNSGLASDLAGISTSSENNVWICGIATISYYNGTSFTFQSGPAGTYNDIFFLNDQEGWVVGNNGLIGHTENGGENWYSQINPDNNSLYKVFFLNETKGWAIGAQGTILHTANGGEDWNIDTVGITTNFLRGVHFTSPTNGYAVGNNKTLLKFGELTSSDDNVLSGETLQLQNFPNPFNPETKISFYLSESYNVSLSIYNIKGQKIKSLLNEQKQAGEHSIIWDGKDALGKPVCSGVYLYKLRVNDKTEAVKKCLLMK